MQMSKKMLMTLVAMGLASIGFLLCAWAPILAGQYTVFVGTISGLLGLFLAGKVAAQHVDQRAATDQHAATVKAAITSSSHPVSAQAQSADLDAAVPRIPNGL